MMIESIVYILVFLLGAYLLKWALVQLWGVMKFVFSKVIVRGSKFFGRNLLFFYLILILLSLLVVPQQDCSGYSFVFSSQATDFGKLFTQILLITTVFAFLYYFLKEDADLESKKSNAKLVSVKLKDFSDELFVWFKKEKLYIAILMVSLLVYAFYHQNMQITELASKDFVPKTQVFKITKQEEGILPVNNISAKVANNIQDGFFIGATMPEVLSIQGLPDAVIEGYSCIVWRYDTSTVTFKHRVVSEYDNLSKNLKLGI